MEKRNTFTNSVGKSEGKGPLGKPFCIWLYSIKMNVKEIGCLGVD
jgi:hypothetical protein